MRPYILLDPLPEDLLDLFDNLLEEPLLLRLLFELEELLDLFEDLLEEPLLVRLLFEPLFVELDPLLFDELFLELNTLWANLLNPLLEDLLDLSDDLLEEPLLLRLLFELLFFELDPVLFELEFFDDFNSLWANFAFCKLPRRGVFIWPGGWMGMIKKKR